MSHKHKKSLRSEGLKRFGVFLLIFCIIFSAALTTVYGQQANSRLRVVSSTFNRFIDMLSESARTYWDIQDNIPAVNILAPDILLVNRDNPIDRYYRPESMIDIARYVRSTRHSLYLEENAARAYIDMVNSMGDAGITDIAAVSGFRDFDHQTRIHNAEINRQANRFPREEARWRAAMIVAAPGTSEHQSGLAVDVSSAEVGFSLTTRFENTRSFRWLSQYAHNYGFIIRYPRDSTEITGVIFEPWHLRYVGIDHAARIFESGLTLEEYFIAYAGGIWSE